MQNKILVSLGILIIISVAFLGIRNSNKLVRTPVLSDKASTTATSTVTAVGGTPPKAVDVVKNTAWAVFQKYIGYTKNHDIVGLKSVAFQTSDICNDPTKVSDCNKLMDSAYSIAKTFVETDFSHVLFDNKQIILSSNFQTVTDSVSRSLQREVIYFTRDKNGTPKVLAFTLPDESTYMFLDKNNPIATSTMDARLAFRVTDTDQDGMPDEVETCSYKDAKDCIKTDPNKKDSLGDGWWDGVRVFLKKP